MASFYLRVEGVNLGNFVFDTQELSTIRGGSFLLLDAIEEVEKQFASEGIGAAVSKGASSGLFHLAVTDGEAAAQLRGKVREFLNDENKYKAARKYQHATFVVDVIRASESGKFSTVRERLTTLNRWQQMQSPSVAVPTFNSTNSSDGACDVDMVRLGTRDLRKGGDATTAKRGRIGVAVKTRNVYGRKLKHEFIARELASKPSYKFARHLSEISHDPDQGNLHHKIAVIYLDGNGFGNIIKEKCQTEEDQKEFQVAIKDYRRGWLEALMREMNGDEKWLTEAKASAKRRYRFELLQWGGDETYFIVPAWYGWRTLELLFNITRGGTQSANREWEIVETNAWHFKDKPLTHAAGVVFCHHNAPINRVTRLAYDLADIAKKDRDGNGKEVKARRNQFAYEILESFDHIGRDLESYRRERLPLTMVDDSARRTNDLTQMILSGDEVGKIQEYMSALKPTIPRRKLFQVTQSLFAPVKTEGATATAQITAPMNDARDALQVNPAASQAMKDFEALQIRDGKNKETAWAHLAALWDYID